MGFDVVMSPTTYCYIDYVQAADLTTEPFSITHQWTKGTTTEHPITLERVYGYDPLAEIPAEDQKHILGVQCNLWTEYVATPKHLEYMLFPRVLALSEIAWSDPSRKDIDGFRKNLADHQLPLLDKLGMNYRKLDK